MKLSNIFNVDTSKGGGIKLFKKIIDKYNLGNEYKDLKTNVENCSSSGGASSRVKYYHCKNSVAKLLASELANEGYLVNVNCYSYDGSNNPIDTYICNYIMLKTFGINFAVRYISFQPISVAADGNRLTINSFDELLSMIGQSAYIDYFEEISEEQFYKID